jgi:hypothetical protein
MATEVKAKSTESKQERINKQKDELENIRLQQKEAAEGGEPLPKIKANRDKNLEINEHEKEYIHVLAITRTVEPDLKTVHEEKRITKHHPRQFAQLIKGGAFNAFDDVRVVHDPRKNAPKDEVLKPSQPTAAPTPADTAMALSVRENKLKEREKALEAEREADKKELEEMKKRLAALEAPKK